MWIGVYGDPLAPVGDVETTMSKLELTKVLGLVVSILAFFGASTVFPASVVPYIQLASGVATVVLSWLKDPTYFITPKV